LDGDLKITEHLAIHQYVSEKWMPSLLGNTVEERAKVRMLTGVLWELRRLTTIGCYTHGDRKKLNN